MTELEAKQKVEKIEKNIIKIKTEEGDTVYKYRLPAGFDTNLFILRHDVDSFVFSNIDEHYLAEVILDSMIDMSHYISVGVDRLQTMVKFDKNPVFAINGGSYCYTDADLDKILDNIMLYFAIDAIWRAAGRLDMYDYTQFDITDFEKVDADGLHDIKISDAALDEILATTDIEKSPQFSELFKYGKSEVKDSYMRSGAYGNWYDGKVVTAFHF